MYERYREYSASKMRFLIEIFVASRRVFSGAVSFFVYVGQRRPKMIVRRASADTTYTEKENNSSLFLWNAPT